MANKKKECRKTKANNKFFKQIRMQNMRNKTA